MWPIGDGGGGNSSLEMTTAPAQIITHAPIRKSL
jgi:hypothetical protein